MQKETPFDVGPHFEFTAVRDEAYVIAAYAAGIVISLLEFACTGQVYLPTIQFTLRGVLTCAALHAEISRIAFRAERRVEIGEGALRGGVGIHCSALRPR